jgi:acyl-coenzyme A thioesterase PaaI-like protein
VHAGDHRWDARAAADRAAARLHATAEGRLFVESDEALIAHGTTGCVILR